MNSPLTRLGHLPVKDFLHNYWQKKAVFLPSVLPDFQSPLSPDEIAGLALESEIESRLITNTDDMPWHLENGPFTEERLTQLPASNWSLLVNTLDHWVPEVRQLLHKFRFIPNWRLDDVMVSIAPDGGSVGPHFDYYDVFLVQGAGQRHWQLGSKCDSQTPLLEGSQLKILREFTPSEEYLASPGDVLYIPPGIAHWGKAAGDNCVTYSIGFRAPSHAEILTEFAQEVASTLNNDMRFTDPVIRPGQAPGLITEETVTRLKDIILQHLDRQALAQWFGRYMTEPKEPEGEQPWQPLSASEKESLQHNLHWLEANASSRFCYYPTGKNATLFVDGQAYKCSLTLAAELSNQPKWQWQKLMACCQSPEDRDLLYELISAEALIETEAHSG